MRQSPSRWNQYVGANTAKTTNGSDKNTIRSSRVNILMTRRVNKYPIDKRRPKTALLINPLTGVGPIPLVNVMARAKKEVNAATAITHGGESCFLRHHETMPTIAKGRKKRKPAKSRGSREIHGARVRIVLPTCSINGSQALVIACANSPISLRFAIADSAVGASRTYFASRERANSEQRWRTSCVRVRGCGPGIMRGIKLEILSKYSQFPSQHSLSSNTPQCATANGPSQVFGSWIGLRCPPQGCLNCADVPSWSHAEPP